MTDQPEFVNNRFWFTDGYFELTIEEKMRAQIILEKMQDKRAGGMLKSILDHHVSEINCQFFKSLVFADPSGF